ncbi:MAG: FecR domain-containing protein [Moraxellaceae bacterium]|nr:FecR domain-containing protein [Moraxellaceae bacterium]
MRQTYPNLNAKGLLTAFVSCLLSGQVIADVAGRVNFVSGKVEAVSADGNRRNLVRGELVNSGERLETNSGRVQIRFTDGSFVSLQPNTVFGLDNYAFNKAQPNEGSLLFNFIRGSMRTVSGAIGKVNRGNYKVQTPVATIGIRGTSYAASQEPNGRLLLTVGKGIVNLQNDFGDSDINAGQTFQVETGKAPVPPSW